MVPGPAEAANLISEILFIDAPPRSTREVLLAIIITQKWFVGDEANDRADLWLRRFERRADFIITKIIDAGGYLLFSFNSSGKDFLQGACYAEPHEPPDYKLAKARRASTLRVYQHCCNLTPERFEQLSGKILSLLRVETSHVSRRSGDQGIDFFGRVPLGEMLKPGLLNPGAEKNIFVWLVGQAKHYQDTKVSTADVRELVGSVEFARAKVFAGTIDPLSELTARLCDPIIYLFFTTGRFTRDSVDLLTRSGVLSFDGLQISQFLADHGVGIIHDKFDETEFNTWLNLI